MFLQEGTKGKGEERKGTSERGFEWIVRMSTLVSTPVDEAWLLLFDGRELHQPAVSVVVVFDLSSLVVTSPVLQSPFFLS